MKMKLLLCTLFLTAGSAVQAQEQGSRPDRAASPKVEEDDRAHRARGPVEVVFGDREDREVERQEAGRDRSRGRAGTIRGDRGEGDRERRTRSEDYRAPSSRTDDYRGRRGDDDDDDEYYSDRRRGNARGSRRGDGPPFCRNGQGHPVHGMAWCRARGFGGYGAREYDARDRRYDSRRYDDRNRRYGDRRYEPSWERPRWEDVIFRRPQRRYPERYLDRGSLIDVLGGRVYHRLEQQRRYLGLRAPLAGYWTEARGLGRNARVLVLHAGDIPLAHLTDRNGDGRVDRILLNNRRF